MIVIATVIFLLVSVKAVISRFIDSAPFDTPWQLWIFSAPSLPLLNVEVVNSLVLMNLFPFDFCQIVTKALNCFCHCHWKFMLANVGYCWWSICVRHFHAHRCCYVYFGDLTACTDWSRGLQCWTSGAEINLWKLKLLLHLIFDAVQLVTQCQASVLIPSR